MTQEEFNKAIKIIGKGINSTVIFRYTNPNGQVSHSEIPSIRITNCTASVINELVDNDYSLSMHEKSINVEKYK